MALQNLVVRFAYLGNVQEVDSNHRPGRRSHLALKLCIKHRENLLSRIRSELPANNWTTFAEESHFGSAFVEPILGRRGEDVTIVVRGGVAGCSTAWTQ